MSGTSDIPLEGELNCWSRGYDLPDILVAICGLKKTGLLRFVSSEAEKRLFVRDGSIVFATSSSEDDRLGEYLLRQGKMSLANLSKCMPLVRPGKRLGAVLVERGLLEPRELVQAVIGQVRTIILSLFRWTEAWYGFDEQELPSKETITLDMPTARLIVEGVRLVDSWRRIVQGLGGLAGVYQSVPGQEGTVRALDLDKASLEILAMLHRAHSIEEACAGSDLPDFEVCRLMWVFRCLGWIERREPSTSEVVPSPSQVEGAAAVAEKVPAGEQTPSHEAPPEPQPEVVEVTSFEMLEEEHKEQQEGGSTPASLEAASTPASVAAEESGSGEPPAASLADLGDDAADGPGGEGFDVEVDLGDPFAAPELDNAKPQEASAAVPAAPAGEDAPLGFSEESPWEDPESLPAAKETEGPAAPPPVEPAQAVPTEAKGSPPGPLETEDMDLEGLGMVLGEEEKR